MSGGEVTGDDIPAHVIESALRLLGGTSAARAACVCRTWRRIVDSEGLWQAAAGSDHGIKALPALQEAPEASTAGPQSPATGGLWRAEYMRTQRQLANWREGECRQRMCQGGTALITRLAIGGTHPHQYVAGLQYDGGVSVWWAPSGRLKQQHTVPRGVRQSGAWLPSMLATDRLWVLAAQSELGFGRSVSALLWDPRGTCAVDPFRLHSQAPIPPSEQVAGGNSDITAVALRVGLAVAGTSQGSVWVRHLPSGPTRDASSSWQAEDTCHFIGKAVEGSVGGVAVADGDQLGRCIFCVGKDCLKIWSVADVVSRQAAQLLLSVGGNVGFSADPSLLSCMTADERRIVLGEMTGEVVVWEWSTYMQACQCKDGGDMDIDRIAAGTRSWEPLWRNHAHSSRIQYVNVHGQRAVSASSENSGTVTMWDLEDSDNTAQLRLGLEDEDAGIQRGCVCVAASLEFCVRGQDHGNPYLTDFN